MAIPTIKPRWAENNETDPLTGAENKVQPTEEFKLSGLKRNELLPRAFLNYQFDLLSRWILYLSFSSDVYDLTTETDLNFDNGATQTVALTGNTTFTESLVEGEELYLKLEANGFTPTFPVSFSWGDAGVPTILTENHFKLKKIGTTVYARQVWVMT